MDESKTIHKVEGRLDTKYRYYVSLYMGKFRTGETSSFRKQTGDDLQQRTEGMTDPLDWILSYIG
jgi:hypothetical protein